ncbi:MAG TPA: winged helix-turn-helix domain-containing protein [Nitrososphaerales archaeon]|nr:winged helix-turn-helix domain-containing protein [Nitrososphaerales archaeon]
MQSLQHARQTQADAQYGLAPAEAVAPKQSPAKNRGRLDVMADILNCCRSSSSKSHIMLYANVNSIVATRMIEKLTETGLLDSVHEAESVVYLATPKGAGFIATYVELQRMISPELVPMESKTNNPNRLNSLNF